MAAERDRTAEAFEALSRAFTLDRDDLAISATLRHGTLTAERSGLRPRSSDAAARLPEPARALADDLELVRVLGTGGMGSVHLARQRSLDREVAVKRLREGAPVERARDALLQEARITGALEHPSIVPVHGLGVAPDGSPLLVMKKIEGASFEALIRDPDHAAWPALERRHGDRLGVIVEILSRVADALSFAHARGFVHRDVKPANVMIGEYGEVYLVDWGVSLRSGSADPIEHDKWCIVGTPAYMAPEMVLGDPDRIGARTDVYLLGATLHCALTGEPPHQRETMQAVLLSALRSDPRSYPEHVPAGLAALASRAMSADPAARFESAIALRDALADFLRHRASESIAREAEARLDALRSDGEREPTSAALATPEAGRTLEAARFGLAHALREWPGNERARAALRTAIAWSIEGELARRSPDGAAALATHLDPPDPGLDARIAALRADLVESKRLEEDARREVAERDLGASSRFRVPLTLLVLALSVGLFSLAIYREHVRGAPRPMSAIVPADMGMLAVSALSMWIFRRRALANRISRQYAAVFLLALGASTVTDEIFAARGATAAEAGSLSLITLGSVMVGAAIGLGGRLWASAGVCFATGITAAIWPGIATPMVGVGVCTTLVVLVYDALGPRKRVEI